MESQIQVYNSGRIWQLTETPRIINFAERFLLRNKTPKSAGINRFFRRGERRILDSSRGAIRPRNEHFGSRKFRINFTWECS